MIPALILIPGIIGIFTSFSLGHFGIYKLKGNMFFSSPQKVVLRGFGQIIVYVSGWQCPV